MSERLTALLQMLADEPDDAFTRYALALEYGKTDTAAGAAKLTELTATHPDYLPTYYTLATWLEELGDEDNALQTAEAGLALAQRLVDKKAEGELRGLVEGLG